MDICSPSSQLLSHIQLISVRLNILCCVYGEKKIFVLENVVFCISVYGPYNHTSRVHNTECPNTAPGINCRLHTCIGKTWSVLAAQLGDIPTPESKTSDKKNFTKSCRNHRI